MIDQKITAVATFSQASNLPLQIVLTAFICLLLTVLVARMDGTVFDLTENQQVIGGLLFIIEIAVIAIGFLWIVWTRL